MITHRIAKFNLYTDIKNVYYKIHVDWFSSFGRDRNNKLHIELGIEGLRFAPPNNICKYAEEITLSS